MGVFAPLCKPDGSYEEVQCYASINQCWCVDKDGNEIAGTRQQGRPSTCGKSTKNKTFLSNSVF